MIRLAPAITSAAGVLLLALTGCVSLGPGESQARSENGTAATNTHHSEAHGESLTHPLADGEVFTHVLDASATLETLRSEMTMSFELDAVWAAQDQELEMISQGAEDYSEAHVTGSVTEHGRVAESFEAYFQDDAVLTNENGRGWEEEQSFDEVDDDADSRYSRVVQSLTELEELLEVTYDDRSYLLEYRGSDRAAFDAFEEPFSLSLDGFEPEETDMTVEATVDPETFFVEEFSFTLHTQDSPDPVSLGMEIQAEYSLFNEIPPLEIPADVLEEVYGPQG
ncbi:DUF6612 family protein [Nesterenkonia suensis]